MMSRKRTSHSKRLEKDFGSAAKEKYILRLYVTGMTSRSVRAIENIKRICDQYLRGRCDLQVIDIYRQPELAEAGQLIAAPTLIREWPLPLRRLIGDMSVTDKILQGLGLG